MSRLSELGNALYQGSLTFDFVGRRRRWYALSALLLLLSVGALVGKGLNFGVEFSGGSVFVVPSQTCQLTDARAAVTDTGALTGVPIVTEIQGGNDRSVRVQTESLAASETAAVTEALATVCDTPLQEVSVQVIGPSWGKQITDKAVTALIVFLLVIVVYLSVTFEWRMAIAALVALFHDVLITVGVYALVGFEVSPASVIGVLTILGYSLYDTVVVFDKVKEKTKGILGGNRLTYTDAANVAVNQVLIRSINTSITSLLPVAGLLFVGAYVLGAGTLKDLALALFVGIAVGTYSSIFVATPVLAELKEREPAMQALTKRVEARRRGPMTPAAAAAIASSSSPSATSSVAVDVATDEDEGAGEDKQSAAPVAKPAATPVRGPRNQPKRTTGKKKRKGGRR